jgi:hypothetical protein
MNRGESQFDLYTLKLLSITFCLSAICVYPRHFREIRVWSSLSVHPMARSPDHPIPFHLRVCVVKFSRVELGEFQI